MITKSFVEWDKNVPVKIWHEGEQMKRRYSLKLKHEHNFSLNKKDQHSHEKFP